MSDKIRSIGKGKLIVAVGAAVVAVTICVFFARYVWCLGRPPTCRTKEELFYVEPEILKAVRPFLSEWATRPANETRQQREQIGKELGVNIDIFEWNRTSNSKPVTVVAVSLETYYDWTRGFLYVNDNTQLVEENGYRLMPVEEHIYAYNTNY